ncbi:hypothetical protein NEIMUCOT_04772 [Neisseria mucosa ATCC 25996]|uniref:Uncharacterized protein n=1 Tax=Neisseria mucosa (strain ATCC 25996 / DSM 4631 / NCTC 10774 / M26) TaxID=546266 RepID=D2ZVX9_NEIM2|nr:hypothetical protein NEIMUCOT_04772 [Neisseria mucosa ATCC 25996]
MRKTSSENRLEQNLPCLFSDDVVLRCDTVKYGCVVYVSTKNLISLI